MMVRMCSRPVTVLLFMAVLMVAAARPAAGAASCGDMAGPKGKRVACACGDTVITSTTLKASDPVVTTPCPGVGLDIGADRIALNCGGLEIRGGPDEAGVQLLNRSGVTVRGCRITGFFEGLLLVGSSGNMLLTNTLTGGAFGMLLDANSNDNRIKGNRVMAPGIDGINLGDARGNTIEGNTLDGAGGGGDGIDLDGLATGNTVKGNRVTGFGGSGIELDFGGNNAIVGNTSSGNGIGIRVFTTEPNTVVRNVLEDNEFEGLLIFGDGHTVDRNQVRRNGFEGIAVSGNGNAITRSIVDANGGAGISLDGDDNTIDLNQGQGNAFNGLELLFGIRNTVTRNTFDGNGEDGVFVGADGGIVEGNRGARNADDGLEVAGFGNRVANNSFQANGDWNICVVVENIDAGGNRYPPVTFDCL